LFAKFQVADRLASYERPKINKDRPVKFLNPLIETYYFGGNIFPPFSMKQLLVVRHAKSSWENFSVPDFERSLNDRGKRDAPEMAERLLQRNIVADVFLTSPAKRAKKTAELFAKTLGINKEAIIEVPELYEAAPDTFYKVVSKAPLSASTVMLFSHNPGITAFVNSLTNVSVDEMPTCAVFALNCDLSDWSQFRAAKKEFLFFDYPKA
jgi:phosphohistidine phosphatase